MLSTPCDKSGVDPLCTGSMLSVLDAFDRGIERYHFGEALATAFALAGSMARMDTVLSMQHLFKNGTLTEEKFFEAVKSLTDFATMNKIKLKEQVEQIKLCPQHGDPIS